MFMVCNKGSPCLLRAHGSKPRQPRRPWPPSIVDSSLDQVGHVESSWLADSLKQARHAFKQHAQRRLVVPDIDESRESTRWMLSRATSGLSTKGLEGKLDGESPCSKII